MGSLVEVVSGELIPQFDSHDQSCNVAPFDGAPAQLSMFPTQWVELQIVLQESNPRTFRSDRGEISSMSLAEFVRRRFIPEFVDTKRSAGRAHFREILKCILQPEGSSSGLAETFVRANAKRKSIQSWPYLDSLRLCEIDEDTIRHVVNTALESGYSIQTVTHIRNVIRAIYSHAIVACSYTGRNPAALVTLPTISHKGAHALTLAQLKEVMAAMRFPERAIALFSILTEMNLVEICGLQWQFVNLSANRHFVEEDWIPAKTIAVRNQWYRGEFRPVTGNRKRFVPLPELLCSILRDLKCNDQHLGPQSFVLASRNGGPVYPGNIAKRRLKSIGRSCEMPWLSWRVFHLTHVRLRAEFGRQFYQEIEKALPLHCW